LIADLAVKYEVADQEWRCYSVKTGWALRLKRGKGTIIWMAPCDGSFQVLVILGEKAVQAARESRLGRQLTLAVSSARSTIEPEGIV
jgi:hypothetical protein